MRGVYTVEAAWVISICIGIFAAAIILGFHIYSGALDYIGVTEPKIFDAALRFREISVGKDIVGAIFGK